MVRATGGSAYVYGHSSGAVLALEAAARGLPARKLAVYEPPYTGSGRPAEPIAARLAELVSAGHRDEAAAQFLSMTGMPAEAVEQVRADPGWPAMQAIAHTLAYDVLLCGNGLVPADLLSRISVPTLVMAGGSSVPWATKSAESVAAAVPNARVGIVEEQGHGIAAEVLAPLLTEFFT